MTTKVGTVDPVTFEILSHRLHQITIEMGTTLERVGGTVNTTQMHDYMAALYQPNGDVLCAGESMGFHVACAGFAVKHIIERFAQDEGIHPGDIFLLNDPYVAAIHQSDIYIIAPIHYGDQLVAWSATFVHVMDIGAMSPGGNSPGATEICHEGLRVPGLKLVERDKLRKDVFDTLINMTRQPVMVGLDLKCEIAANNVARARVRALLEQYGPELFQAVSWDMLRYSESILRRRISEMADGQWSETSMIQADKTWKAKLTLTKEGDSLLFDFTGSDPQAQRGINLPYHATFGSCFGAVLATMGYDIPKNQGAFVPIRVIAPPGTVVNVKYPGPVSLNTTSGGATVRYLAESTLMQMLATNEHWKHEVMAVNNGGRFARHAGMNQHGRYYVSTILENSAMGATSYRDGTNSAQGFMTSHNVEWLERNFPLLYLFRRHLTDGGGAGKFRGGAAAEVAMTLHDAPEGRIKAVAFGVAGLKNAGQGLFGGGPGAPSRLVHVEDTAVEERLSQGKLSTRLEELGGNAKLLPYCDFDLKKGDVLYMSAASGGGYGDPLNRDPLLVLADVQKGLISSEAAGSVYGVVLSNPAGEVDLPATEQRRAELRRARLGDKEGPSVAKTS